MYQHKNTWKSTHYLPYPIDINNLSFCSWFHNRQGIAIWAQFKIDSLIIINSKNHSNTVSFSYKQSRNWYNEKIHRFWRENTSFPPMIYDLLPEWLQTRHKGHLYGFLFWRIKKSNQMISKVSFSSKSYLRSILWKMVVWLPPVVSGSTQAGLKWWSKECQGFRSIMREKRVLDLDQEVNFKF